MKSGCVGSESTKYGPGSEKLSNLQLELLDLEPGVSNVEVAAESERERLPCLFGG